MYTIKATATLAILALLGLASAECNSTGQKASQATMDAAREDAQLDSICGVLTGTYHLREKRETCIEIGGNKYDFTLKYDAKDGWFSSPAATRAIALAECKDGMKKELACSRGGKTMYGNWWYRADYNLGKCTQPVRRSAEAEAETEAGDDAEVEVDGEVENEVVAREHSRAFTA